jgi:hypothetical protein
MVSLQKAIVLALAFGVLGAPAPLATAQGRNGGKDARRPSFSLKASPSVGFTPARVVLSAELKGGANDYEELYCAGVEWDWGDQTSSASVADCAPYEAGVSEIRRRFTMEHIYRTPGSYKVMIRLKKSDKTIIAASATVQVQPGARDISRFD